jgi:hypothetical protein
VRRSLAALLFLVACRHRLPAAPFASETGLVAWAPIHWPGEQLEYSLAWRGIPVARLWILSGEPGDVEGRRAAIVQMAVESDGLLVVVKRIYDEMTSVIDLRSGGVLANSGTFEALFRGWAKQGKPSPVVAWTKTPPAEEPNALVHDALSTTQLLRAWPRGLAAGHFYGSIGYWVFRVDVVAAGEEELECLGERVRTFRLDAIIRQGKGYRFRAWITDDERRLPARLDADTDFGGKVSVTLDRASRP